MQMRRAAQALLARHSPEAREVQPAQSAAQLQGVRPLRAVAPPQRAEAQQGLRVHWVLPEVSRQQAERAEPVAG